MCVLGRSEGGCVCEGIVRGNVCEGIVRGDVCV